MSKRKAGLSTLIGVKSPVAVGDVTESGGRRKEKYMVTPNKATRRTSNIIW
jgi:hypothetical protein